MPQTTIGGWDMPLHGMIEMKTLHHPHGIYSIIVLLIQHLTHTLVLLAEVLVVVIIVSTKTEHRVLGARTTTRLPSVQQQFGKPLDHN